MDKITPQILQLVETKLAEADIETKKRLVGKLKSLRKAVRESRVIKAGSCGDHQLQCRDYLEEK